MHMVRRFEDAGAAAVQIEDQLLPKKCGHLNDKKLADPNDMAAKIAAAAGPDATSMSSSRVPMRPGSEGMDGAVARAKLYLRGRCRRHLSGSPDRRGEMFREFARRVPDAPFWPI